MTKAELTKEYELMKAQLDHYKDIGSIDRIWQKIEEAETAKAEIEMIRRILK